MVLQDDVRYGDQVQQQVPTTVHVMVHRSAQLVPVQGIEAHIAVPGPFAAVPVGVGPGPHALFLGNYAPVVDGEAPGADGKAYPAFDLDHLGPPVGEKGPGVGPGPSLGDGHDADAPEGEGETVSFIRDYWRNRTRVHGEDFWGRPKNVKTKVSPNMELSVLT